MSSASLLLEDYSVDLGCRIHNSGRAPFADNSTTSESKDAQQYIHNQNFYR